VQRPGARRAEEDAGHRVAAAYALSARRDLDGFSNAAEGDLEVRGSQTWGGVHLPQQVQQLAREVFESSFLEAMHPTLVIPIAIALLAAISSFAVERRNGKAQPYEAEQQPEEVVA